MVVFVFKRANVKSVATILSIINTTMLFLRARTNFLAYFIRVLLLIYYTFYHFISRVVIIKGIIYAVLAFRQSRPN